MSVNQQRILRFTSLSRLLAANLDDRARWEQWNAGSFVRSGRGSATAAMLDGVYVDMATVGESTTLGYEVLQGATGLTVNADGSLTFVANDTNPTVEIAFRFLGSRSDWGAITAKVSGMVSASPTPTGTAYACSRGGLRVYSSGGAAPGVALGEHFVRGVSAVWEGNTHTFDGASSHSLDALPTGFTLADIKEQRLYLYEQDLGSVNYPSIGGSTTETQGILIPETGSLSGAHIGINRSGTPSTEYFTYYADRGAATRDFTVTLHGVMANTVLRAS